MKSLSLRVVLAAAAGVVVCIVAVVMWGLNRGPDFPPISYFPNDIALPTPAEIAGQSALPGSGDGSTGDIPLSYGTPSGFKLSLADMSPEEKLEAIKQKYQKIFLSMKAAYEKELNRMMACAKKDYIDVKSGRKNITLSQLAMEYIKIGRALEKESDQRFAGYLEEMRKELASHNLPRDLADQAEREYQNQKNQVRKELVKYIARYSDD